MDTRPQLERTLTRARVACLLLVVGCAALGAGLAATAVVWLTKDRSA